MPMRSDYAAEASRPRPRSCLDIELSVGSLRPQVVRYQEYRHRRIRCQLQSRTGYIFAKLDELEPAARSPRSNGRREEALRRPPQASTSPRSASRPSARRVASTSSARTTRPCSARPARRSSTSSSTARRRSRSTARPSRPRRARWSTCSRRRSGRRRPTKTARRSWSSAAPRARRTSLSRRKPRRHSRPTTQATTRPRSRSSSSSSRSGRAIPLRTSTPGASRPGPATPTRRSRHLGRAVEINDRIKELMATDEDLDSIREDQRFAELMK